MAKTPPPSLEMALVPSRAADEAQPGDFGARVLDGKLVLHPNVHDQLMAAQIDVTNAAHFLLTVFEIIQTLLWRLFIGARMNMAEPITDSVC